MASIRAGSPSNYSRQPPGSPQTFSRPYHRTTAVESSAAAIFSRAQGCIGPIGIIAFKVAADRERREKNKKDKKPKFQYRICDIEFVGSGQMFIHEAGRKH